VPLLGFSEILDGNLVEVEDFPLVGALFFGFVGAGHKVTSILCETGDLNILTFPGEPYSTAEAIVIVGRTAKATITIDIAVEDEGLPVFPGFEGLGSAGIAMSAGSRIVPFSQHVAVVATPVSEAKCLGQLCEIVLFELHARFDGQDQSALHGSVKNPPGTTPGVFPDKS